MSIAHQGKKKDGHREFHSSRRMSSTASSPRPLNRFIAAAPLKIRSGPLQPRPEWGGLVEPGGAGPRPERSDHPQLFRAPEGRHQSSDDGRFIARVGYEAGDRIVPSRRPGAGASRLVRARSPDCRRGAWSVISLPSASPAIGHRPLFPRHSPSQSPTVGASPEDPRRTKQIRSESGRDQRAVKTNFAACQAGVGRQWEWQRGTHHGAQEAAQFNCSTWFIRRTTSFMAARSP